MSYIQKYPFSQILLLLSEKRVITLKNQGTKGVINMHIFYISTCMVCVCVYLHLYISYMCGVYMYACIYMHMQCSKK